MNFNAGATISRPFALASGSVGLGSPTNTVVMNGANFSWSGGALTGSGSLDLTGGAQFDLAGAGARVLNGPALTLPNMTLGGGSLDVQGGALVLPGTVSLAAGSTLRLSGGRLDVQNGVLPRLSMTGGTLVRTTAGDLTIAGAFDVSGGSILAEGAPGDFITQGTTLVNGVVSPLRNWVNTGTLTLDAAGKLNPSPGGGFVFTNQPGAVLNLGSAQAFPLGAPGDSMIRNNGTVNVDAPGPDPMNLGNPFTNAAGARLNVNSGTLVLPSTPAQSGTVEVRSGATLSSGGNDLTNAAPGILGGAGTLDLSGHTLTNDGTVHPGALGGTGTLTLNGAFLNSAGGTFDVKLGGQASGAFGQLVSTGPVNLGGTLVIDVIAGTAIAPGDRYEVMTYPSRTGNFGSVTVPASQGFRTEPGPMSYQAVAIPPEMAAPATVTAHTTKDALVFSDRLFDLTPRAAPPYARTRDELPECR